MEWSSTARWRAPRGWAAASAPFADAPERARTAVQKAVKRAIDEIAAANPAIGQHLARRVETGATCCYRPESGSIGA